MPAKSAKQRRLMQAVAHNAAFAKRVGIPQKVGKEFIGKAAGGSMKESKETMKMARGGGVESKGKTKGKTVKMARGGGVESKGKTRGKIC